MIYEIVYATTHKSLCADQKIPNEFFRFRTY